jgi:hypothetical protein
VRLDVCCLCQQCLPSALALEWSNTRHGCWLLCVQVRSGGQISSAVSLQARLLLGAQSWALRSRGQSIRQGASVLHLDAAVTRNSVVPFARQDGSWA